MRNAFTSVELIETFLYCCHKLNALGYLLERTVVRQGANRFKYDLFLCDGLIMRLTTLRVNTIESYSVTNEISYSGGEVNTQYTLESSAPCRRFQ